MKTRKQVTTLIPAAPAGCGLAADMIAAKLGRLARLLANASHRHGVAPREAGRILSAIRRGVEVYEVTP